MDLMDILKLATDHMSEYLWAFSATLRNPILRFRPLPVVSDGQVVATLLPQPPIGSRISPKLISFVAISISIGTIISGLIPAIQFRPDFIMITFVVIPIYWLFSSFITHGLCKLFRGKGTFTDTLSITLQIASVLYVVSSFITLLVSTVILAFQPGFGLSTTPQAFTCNNNILLPNIFNPINFSLLIHFVLLSIYLPLALKHVHDFGRWQLVAIIILSLLISRIPQYLFSTTIYNSINILAPGGGC